MNEREIVLLAIGGLASVGGLVATGEWLANHRQLAAAGLLGWEHARALPLPGRLALRGPLGFLLDYPNILGLLLLRLAALLALPAALWHGRYQAAALGVVFFTTLLLNLRSADALDGSDQMATQVFGALFLGYLPGTELALEAALAYLALQSCLSYLTAGAAKLRSPAWRDGSALLTVLSTRTYGEPKAARFLAARPRLARWLSWSAVLVELAFPLALFAGLPVTAAFLAWGVAFHALNARLLGFNTFFWSFLATYPAIVHCALQLA